MNDNRKKNLILLLGIGAFCIILALSAYVILRFNEKLNLVNYRIVELQQQQQVQHQQVQHQQLQQTIILSDMANKVEEITQGLGTDQKKCLAIARWVAANISNRPNELAKFPGMNNVFTWYSERAGLCGAKSVIFIEMLKLINIQSKLFNLYDFPNPPQGHTCVQVWYDNDWHFFDTTYAGVFMDKDNVMSFEEILAQPQYALDNMVIFEDSIDKASEKYFAENKNPTTSFRIDKNRLMRETYTFESLKNLKCSGAYHFVDGLDIAVIRPTIDCSTLPMVFGKLDNQWIDIRDFLIESWSEVSQYICHGLAGEYHIKSNWLFVNTDPETKYYLKYNIYNVQKPGGKFYAVPDGAKIISGEELVLNEYTKEWTIIFSSYGSSCSMLIDYDIKIAGEGANIDVIEIGKIE